MEKKAMERHMTRKTDWSFVLVNQRTPKVLDNTGESYKRDYGIANGLISGFFDL